CLHCQTQAAPVLSKSRLVPTANARASATINTTGATFTASVLNAGPLFADVSRLRAVSQPAALPSPPIMPPLHVFQVNTHSGAISTSTQAPSQMTQASSTPADERDIHSRSRSFKNMLEMPANTAIAA